MQVAHTVGEHDSVTECALVNLINSVKKLENNIVYYKTLECQHLIFWSVSQGRVHCHTAELEPNQSVLSQWYSFVSVSLFLSSVFSWLSVVSDWVLLLEEKEIHSCNVCGPELNITVLNEVNCCSWEIVCISLTDCVDGSDVKPQQRAGSDCWLVQPVTPLWFTDRLVVKRGNIKELGEILQHCRFFVMECVGRGYNPCQQ
jgi:hypothetical protein